MRKIEIEVETLEGVKEAVEAGADIIMLDNMSVEDMTAAVKYIGGRAFGFYCVFNAACRADMVIL